MLLATFDCGSSGLTSFLPPTSKRPSFNVKVALSSLFFAKKKQLSVHFFITLILILKEKYDMFNYFVTQMAGEMGKMKYFSLPVISEPHQSSNIQKVNKMHC